MARSGSVLLDTGVLVALLYADDGKHPDAMAWLAQTKARLHTVEAVLTEAAFLLPAHQRRAVADFAASGSVQVHQPDRGAYTRIGAILQKYADSGPDWADASLVWLAEDSGIHNIATLDVRDFSTYRIHGRSKFQLEAIR